jgi:acyl-CoA thioesterase YciA
VTDSPPAAAPPAEPTAAPRSPILRVVPGPSDINANGHIFGGWVLSQMDIAAGIVAGRRANGSTATVAIERMEFIAPIDLRDLISVYAEVEKVGRTSMVIRIEVVAERDRGRRQIKVTEGLFTFVAVDDNHRPRPIDPSSPGVSGEGQDQA